MLFYDLSLRLTKPSKVLIKGASGTGKSTLLQLVAGKISPNSGRIIVRDNQVENLLIIKGISLISLRIHFSDMGQSEKI